MTTASPTPFAVTSFGNGRPRHTSSRILPKTQPSRPQLRRNDQIDNFSQGYGFNADAPMLQSISYGDSSDDEMPQPMHFSALTKAILEDKQPVRTSPSPRDSHHSHSRSGSGKSVEPAANSRAGTPSGGGLRILRRSPPLDAQQDGISPARVIRLSGTRQSSGLRRTASSADVRLVNGATEVEKLKEYVTPAPAPRTRSLRSRTNSTTSGHSSHRAQSVESHSGPSSGSQREHAVVSSFEHSADQGAHVSDDASSRAPSRAAGEVLPGSTRMKRFNIGSGTYLKGAPMRRPLRRRQSEDDQSAPDDDRGGSMLEADDVAVKEGLQSFSREGAAKSSQTDARDFAQDDRSQQRNHRAPLSHDRRAERREASRPPSRQDSHHKPPHQQLQSDLRSQASEDSKSAQPPFRIPAPPVLPTFNNQENEPPPTFKRNKPQTAGVLGIREKIPTQAEPRSKMLADTLSTGKSPQRHPLAPRSVNTPQRPAPPPPKMSVLETATATAGASTVKSKRKRSHVTINGKIFSLKGRLGKGGSSDVYRVMAENEKMFALKKVNLEDCNEDTVRGYKGEIELLKKLENVDRVVRLFDWEVNEQKQSLSVLMEIGESDLNRILSARLHPEDAELDLSFTRHYWREMLECVASVHDYDIVHSDLKPANFLLVQGRLKLIDFGIANAIDTDNTVNVHRETNVGTPNYMSPESLQDTNAEARSSALPGTVAKLMKLGKPSDVWSLGCILYQMTYGKPPFAHIANQWNRVMAIINPSVAISYPPTGVGGVTVPNSLKRLLKSCLNRDPAERPTLAQLLGRKEAFLNPDTVLEKWEAEGAVPVTEHVLEQILGKIVERCKDPKRGCPTSEEMKVYPRAFLDRVKEMRGL